ncbi:MAG: hypothetical protein J2P15_14200, partial [Micromonosporaceae bacterium]|nr:hypothetical protein [Micromonosporaceae bacterium]
MTPEHRQPAAQASPGWPASVPPVSQASPSAFGPAGPAGLAAPPVSGYPVGQGSPPPGPGVLVPFSAPPTERDRKRLWITLGISGFLLLLCCVGGVVGFGGLIVESNRATEAASVTVVHDYLEGLRTRNFGSSYNQLCPQLQQQTSRSEFQSTQE